MYNVLTEYGDENQAIRFAEKLIKNQQGKNYAKDNPCTIIHLLVIELRGDSDELKKLF